MLICNIVQCRVAEYSFDDTPDLLRISSLDVSILICKLDKPWPNVAGRINSHVEIFFNIQLDRLWFSSLWIAFSMAPFAADFPTGECCHEYLDTTIFLVDFIHHVFLRFVTKLRVFCILLWLNDDFRVRLIISDLFFLQNKSSRFFSSHILHRFLRWRCHEYPRSGCSHHYSYH